MLIRYRSVLGLVSRSINRSHAVQTNTKFSSTPEQKKLMERGLPKKAKIPGVNHVILVSSAKGGVGKSTCAVNLAISLAKQKLSVGLLDADVFGPSVPRMMNLSGEPDLTPDNLMIPLNNYGVKCMSMGFLVDERKPIVWRGLMVMQAIQRMLKQVVWRPLDVLVVDMPPGTGDVQLSVLQNIPVDGAVIVTTPQRVAVSDAFKGCAMFKTMDVPLLGIIENQSWFECFKCGERHQLYGDCSAAARLAMDFGTKILAQLPHVVDVVTACDTGAPLVVSKPDSNYAKLFAELAENVWNQLSSTIGKTVL